MRYATVRKYALSLPGVSEEPHFIFVSFRVGKKIFVTVPPDGESIHVFLPEFARETALVLYPEFTEKLFWGKRVAGIRVILGRANAGVVKDLVYQAWRAKAPQRLVAAGQEKR